MSDGMMRRLRLFAVLATAVVGLAGCGGDGDTGAKDAGGDAAATDAGDSATVDAPDVTDAEIPPLLLGPTIAKAPVDPLAGTTMQSCGVHGATRCEGGKTQTCAIYDTAAKAFVSQPDALLLRVFDYDRWYDLHESPDGTASERVFGVAMPGEATEGVWADPANFVGYVGTGDGAIWTGAALTSAAMRYVTTGTTADYDRMEAITRNLLRHFDVTGVPGYLARHTYILAPEGTPQHPDHIIQIGEKTVSARDVPVRASELGVLPKAYVDGLPDGKGGTATVKAMWNGNPSIDQYTGPMMAFPIVYDLLQDEALKKAMADHLVCYFNRLRRVEIINLQKNPGLHESITAYFGGGAMNLDPGDLDLTKLDRIVGYYLDDLNVANVDSYDRSCPDGPALQPTLTLDAASPGFLGEMLVFATRVGAGDSGKANAEGIAHMYVPNVRGGDAAHLLHLAAMAYRFTGKEIYRTFFWQELVGALQAVEVAKTTQAFQTPDWCASFYGDHITYTTLWQFTTMLQPGPMRDAMVEVMHVEEWEKALRRAHNAQFDLMYASVVPDAAPYQRKEAIADAATMLAELGGNGGVLHAPRRTHGIDGKFVIDNLPKSIKVLCPSEEQRKTCEGGVKFLGIQLEGKKITHVCDGRAGECKMADGSCTNGLASEGLPAGLRPYADFTWQRNPYQIGDGGNGGRHQSPGRDLSQAFWLGTAYGMLPQAKGKVLAWQDGASCQP